MSESRQLHHHCVTKCTLPEICSLFVLNMKEIDNKVTSTKFIILRIKKKKKKNNKKKK